MDRLWLARRVLENGWFHNVSVLVAITLVGMDIAYAAANTNAACAMLMQHGSGWLSAVGVLFGCGAIFATFVVIRFISQLVDCIVQCAPAAECFKDAQVALFVLMFEALVILIGVVAFNDFSACRGSAVWGLLIANFTIGLFPVVILTACWFAPVKRASAFEKAPNI